MVAVYHLCEGGEGRGVCEGGEGRGVLSSILLLGVRDN